MHEINRFKRNQELYEVFVKQINIGVCRFEFKHIQYIETDFPISDQIELLIKHVYIAEANNFMANMFGYKVCEKFLGKRLSDLILVSEARKREIFKKFIEDNYTIHELELNEIDHLGVPRIIEINIIGIIEKNKLISGWSIVRDITAKRKAEKAREESEERYKAVAEGIPNIVFTSYSDGRSNYFNNRWYDYTGSTFELSKDWNWKNYIHPEDLDKMFKSWTEAVQTGNGFDAEYRIKRKDGTYRWFIGRSIPLKNKDGKILSWHGTLTDIDDQKKISEQLKKINEDLDIFTYTVSHDLKAPLSNIEALLGLLFETMNEERKIETAEVVDMLKTSLDKFRNTLGDLIKVTQSQKSAEDVFKMNEIAKVVESEKELLAMQISNSHATIHEDFKDAPLIKFPPMALQTIIYNLISNSIKYRCPERNPVINISTKNLDNYILLTVQDNGLGFEKDQLSKVFTQFKRFHTNIEGSGVGLFIVKKIMNKAEGNIELESEKGKGTIFKLFFKRED